MSETPSSANQICSLCTFEPNEAKRATSDNAGKIIMLVCWFLLGRTISNTTNNNHNKQTLPWHCSVSFADQTNVSSTEALESNDKPQAADAATNNDAKSFDDMDLPEDLLRGIYGYGFETPSVIQQKAICPAMLGKDMIAQAQSGAVRCCC